MVAVVVAMEASGAVEALPEVVVETAALAEEAVVEAAAEAEEEVLMVEVRGCLWSYSSFHSASLMTPGGPLAC